MAIVRGWLGVKFYENRVANANLHENVGYSVWLLLENIKLIYFTYHQQKCYWNTSKKDIKIYLYLHYPSQRLLVFLEL